MPIPFPLVTASVRSAEHGSSHAADEHLAVISTPPRREERDLVAEAADGSFAASGLGRLDPRTRSVLFEPVRRNLGATQAIVSARRCRSSGATQALRRSAHAGDRPRRLAHQQVREQRRQRTLLPPSAHWRDAQSQPMVVMPASILSCRCECARAGHARLVGPYSALQVR
ncbi:hypothetical protein AMIS_26640 [Actinoplanes missouriensis 431]|uniref:Uncharacterized protein n=1 Tax=Actinoplanes missouriensis (strain ATCC 14538 / DSM 43046 / CBS 188.64 / JCM 3121 / NBRC 102363 / NCIMB 12654 / NRRL B-3342 / UNCC 431) TaxID=512565 RepID=I0H4E7_ACTM4|nr:hypothetical protein AMIS_26640 [Actinoplanes missouriensis 431]